MADEDEIEIEFSKHDRMFTQGDITVTVAIYHEKGKEGGWILEVENRLGGSTIWQDTFETDDDAWIEFMAVVREDGLEQFEFDDVDGDETA